MMWKQWLTDIPDARDAFHIRMSDPLRKMYVCNDVCLYGKACPGRLFSFLSTSSELSDPRKCNHNSLAISNGNFKVVQVCPTEIAAMI